jgi:hypothetical protein
MEDKILYTTWESTLIKSKDFKWKSVYKNKEDGKLDFDLHLPLTALFKRQAKQSFAQGMIVMMGYFISKQNENKSIDANDLDLLFNQVGLPEIAIALRGSEISQAFHNKDVKDEN